MEKLQSLFKTATSELINTPMTFSLISMSPYSYKGKVDDNKITVVLAKDAEQFIWEGVEKKKFIATNAEGKTLWEAKVGDEIDVTLRPPVPGGKYSWFFVCAKGFFKPDTTDTYKEAKKMFSEEEPKSKQHIGVRGILQALMSMQQIPSDEEVLALIDRSIEIDQLLRDRMN